MNFKTTTISRDAENKKIVAEVKNEILQQINIFINVTIDKREYKRAYKEIIMLGEGGYIKFRKTVTDKKQLR